MKLEPSAGVSAERIHALASRVIWACIFSLTVLFTATCHAFSQVQATPAGGDLAASMDRVAADVYRPGVPGAAVIVVRDGRVIFRKGYGLANLELNIPVKPEMVFRLASVTKQFTAVAVMMLVEQGRLSLQDDITKFFPGYPTGGRRITVENLLTHTSGIKDYTGKLWPARMREDLRVERLIDVFKDDGLEFEPGTKQSYSNSNYILLGAIIERLSGKEYRRFIEENIFRPLGMRHSYYEGTQEWRFWTERELGALLSKETLIPVLHNVTFEGVKQYSGILPDLAGFTTAQVSIADIAKKIAAAVLIDDSEGL
jgi:D-alanyl-D-alanine carboxypeptidase